MKKLLPTRFTKPHLNGRLWRGNQLFVSTYVHPTIFREICQDLGMDTVYLLQDESWTSELFFEEFMAKLKNHTIDPNLMRKIGRFTMSPEAMNSIEYLLNTLVPFAGVLFYGMAIQYKKYNKKNILKISKIGVGHFVYKMSPKDPNDPPSSIDVCEASMGMFEGADKLVKLDWLKVEHTKCLNRGDSFCEFDVKYSARSSWLKRFGLVAGILLLVILLNTWVDKLAVADSLTKFIIEASIFIASLMFLIAGWSFTKLSNLIRFINRYHVQADNSVKEAHERNVQLEEKINELSLIHSLTQSLTSSIDKSIILETCLADLEKRFGYPRCFVMLLTEDMKQLYVSAVNDFGDETNLIHHLTLTYPAQKDSNLLFANILGNGQTVAIFDVESYAKALKPNLQQLLERIRTTSLIVAPIQDTERKYGLLVVGSIKKDVPLKNEDLARVNQISLILSAAFKNARMFEGERNARQVLEKISPSAHREFENLKGGFHEFRPQWSFSTIFYVDMRNFTELLADLPAERGIMMTNIYQNYMHTRLIDGEGVIDRLNGDQVVSYWPQLDGSNDKSMPTEALTARRGLLAAVKILAEMDKLDSELAKKGFASVSFGIGLHSGRVLFGLVGSQHKMDFCPTGTTMAIASRLESKCKEYMSPARSESAKRAVIVMTESTFQLAGIDIPAEDLGEQKIRGSKQTWPLRFLDQKTCQDWYSSVRKVNAEREP